MNPGTVSAIGRYPVKSMRGESLATVAVGFQGLPLDRRFAFVREESRSPWPWLTGRDCPAMLQCQPLPAEGGEGWPGLVVRTGDGDTFGLASPELANYLQEKSGKAVRLHSDHRAIQDVAYISVISTATVRALSEAAGVEDDQRRFRMNFVVDLGDEPFAEAAWVGRQVRLGGATLAVHQPDQRCQMITLHPETGAATPAVLKKAGELNGACAGVYCSVVVEGEVAVGDRAVLA